MSSINRPLTAPNLTFDLTSQLAELRQEEAYHRSGRAGRTLAKSGRMRVTLVAMTRGNVIGTHQADSPLTLLFFGYTNCPDICPTTMATLGQFDRLLAETVVDTLTQRLGAAGSPWTGQSRLPGGEFETPEVLEQQFRKRWPWLPGQAPRADAMVTARRTTRDSPISPGE